MVKAKLTPQMKKYIEKNFRTSNRVLAGKLSAKHEIDISHTIVGRHKKSWLETSLETKVERPTRPVKSKISRPTIDIDPQKYYDLQDGFSSKCRNRGASIKILQRDGRDIIDQMIHDIVKEVSNAT